jgi:hypothetical protein
MALLENSKFQPSLNAKTLPMKYEEPNWLYSAFWIRLNTVASNFGIYDEPLNKVMTYLNCRKTTLWDSV